MGIIEISSGFITMSINRLLQAVKFMLIISLIVFFTCKANAEVKIVGNSIDIKQKKEDLNDISSLKQEILNLNNVIIRLTQKIEQLITNNDIKNLNNNPQGNINSTEVTQYLNQLLKYENAFILNSQGKAVAWIDRKSTRLNSSHSAKSRMPSSA